MNYDLAAGVCTTNLKSVVLTEELPPPLFG